jgi:large subunit ribosomal protein L9
MDVILLTKVANLGNIGDRVKVKSGYGRNFLLPKGKATLATPENVKKFEARRAELEKVAREQFQDAESRAAAFKDFKLQITAKAGTEGKLFGSIGTADIAEAATNAGHKVARAEVRLPTGPLRTVGEHTITLHLHTDIDVQLPVVAIARSRAVASSAVSRQRA